MGRGGKKSRWEANITPGGYRERLYVYAGLMGMGGIRVNNGERGHSGGRVEWVQVGLQDAGLRMTYIF